MKPFFIVIFALIAFFAMSATAADLIPITWAPFTNEFKIISFSFPIDLKFFSTGEKDNQYIFTPTFKGLEFDGDIDISTSTASASSTTSTSSTFTSNHKPKGPFTVTFPSCWSDASNSRVAVFYLRVKSINNPTVSMTIQSVTENKKIVDETAYPLTNPPTVLGSLTMTTFKNKTDSHYRDDGFTFTLSNFAPPSTEAKLFAIKKAAPFGASFSLRNHESGPLCTINGKSVKSSLGSDGLILPKTGFDATDKTLNIACPMVGLEYSIGDVVFVATWLDKDVTKVAVAQTITKHSIGGGPGAGVVIAIIICIGVAVAVGVLIYFFVIKKKKAEGENQVLIGDNDYAGR